MSFQTRKSFVHFREHKLRCFWWNRRALRPSIDLQHNWNVPRSRNVVRTSVKQSMWHQWLNFSFVTIFIYFSKKTKITIYSTILLPRVTSSAILEIRVRDKLRQTHSIVFKKVYYLQRSDSHTETHTSLQSVIVWPSLQRINLFKDYWVSFGVPALYVTQYEILWICAF